MELREQYADEGDPPPYSSIHPPNFAFGKNDDPDILLAILQAYAGQATVLDLCVALFWEWFSNAPVAPDTTVVFQSLRGMPLGEHGWIGPDGPALYSEVVHTPLIVRVPERVPAALRVPALVEPADLFATFLELFVTRWEADQASYRHKACFL